MKFNMSMDDDLFERVNEFSKTMHISRSSLISMSVQQYLDAQAKIPTLLNQIDELAVMMPIFKNGLDDVKEVIKSVQTK